MLGVFGGRLPEAKSMKSFFSFFRFDPIEFPQLHVAAIRGKNGMFKTSFNDFICYDEIGVEAAVRSTALNNGFKRIS